MTARASAHARAGLIGNPSDGYGGKTISFIVRNFKAEVTLRESAELVIEPQRSDLLRFASMDELDSETQRFGYYGGVRLLRAAIRTFGRYCKSHEIALAQENCTVSYKSNIPRLVGLAGSSAIVTACIKALISFYGVAIPQHVLPNLALAAERDELGIGGGLQDRVIQVYQGAMFMDFDRSLLDKDGYGSYRPIDPTLLPPLYVAYCASQAEGSERTHNDLRARFEAGDSKVVDVMKQLADLAEQGRELLMQGRGSELKPLINSSFDLRRAICPISAGNLLMIETARKLGASSQFAGSGGAIVGTYKDDTMYRSLERELLALGCAVVKPIIS